MRFIPSFILIGVMFFAPWQRAAAIEGKGGVFIGMEGQRFELPDKSLSLIPPGGWEVHSDIGNLTLLLRPKENEGSYLRNIQILKLKNPTSITEASAQSAQEKFIARYADVSKSIQNFTVRNYSLIRLQNGYDAILYYTSFELSGEQMMQAHILTSSQEHSYLMTFTDLRSHFEGEQTGPYLKQAWDAMMSLELPSPPPKPQNYGPFIVGLVLLALLSAVLMALRRRRHVRAVQQYSLFDEDLAEEEDGKEEVRLEFGDNTNEGSSLSGGFVVSADGSLERLDEASGWNLKPTAPPDPKPPVKKV